MMVRKAGYPPPTWNLLEHLRPQKVCLVLSCVGEGMVGMY